MKKYILIIILFSILLFGSVSYVYNVGDNYLKIYIYVIDILSLLILMYTIMVTQFYFFSKKIDAEYVISTKRKTAYRHRSLFQFVFGTVMLSVLFSKESVFNTENIIRTQINAFCYVLLLTMFSIILLLVNSKKFFFFVFATKRRKHRESILSKNYYNSSKKNISTKYQSIVPYKNRYLQRSFINGIEPYIISNPFLCKQIFYKGIDTIFKCSSDKTIRKLQYGLPFEKEEYFEFIYKRNNNKEIIIKK